MSDFIITEQSCWAVLFNIMVLFHYNSYLNTQVLRCFAVVNKATVCVWSPVEAASVRLLLGAPANQSRSAPIQALWGLEKHDIMHSSDPLCENKEWNIFISPQQTTVDDRDSSALWYSAVPFIKYTGSLALLPRCVQRSLGGASVRPSGQWRMGRPPCLWSGTAVMGA